MLEASAQRIERTVGESDLVLDVGGWAKPFRRADWVIDLMPYESRGLYGNPVDPERERFTDETWIQYDICSHVPWPFGDNQFDFVTCSHTLEDVRDPIWVCHELNRVAKAGYIEVPSRLEEQAFGVHGPYVGWSHHRWLVDIDEAGVHFLFKPHVLHGAPNFSFPAGFAAGLDARQRVETLFWEEEFRYREVLLFEPAELDANLADFVAAHMPADGGGWRQRLARKLRRAQ